MANNNSAEHRHQRSPSGMTNKTATTPQHRQEIVIEKWKLCFYFVEHLDQDQKAAERCASQYVYGSVCEHEGAKKKTLKRHSRSEFDIGWCEWFQ